MFGTALCEQEVESAENSSFQAADYATPADLVRKYDNLREISGSPVLKRKCQTTEAIV
jgi:hypothetical protein